MGSLAFNEVRRLDGSLVLLVTGIVDDGTVESFEKGLDWATRAGSRRAIVDLSACQLDSAGLAALVRFKRRSRGLSVETRLVVPDLASFRMLQLIGLTSQFSTYRTLDAALHLPPQAPSRGWGPGVAAMRPSRHEGPRRGLAKAQSSLDGRGLRGTPLPAGSS